MRYVIEGTDHRGRRFRGVYDEADAKYLLESDRLNRVVDLLPSCEYNQNTTTNERTN
jgi:hypothetical protein